MTIGEVEKVVFWIPRKPSMVKAGDRAYGGEGERKAEE